MKEVNEIFNQDNTCCFTGPRPKKLPWGYDEFGIRYLLFRRKYKKAIIDAIKKGKTLFISGVALGIDMLAAKLVLELKKKYPHIKLECAIPCLNQTKKWFKQESIDEYNKILAQADFVTQVSNYEYFEGCMAKRNKYMVDKSSMLIAVYNGQGGGTLQTIKMAEKAHLEVVIIEP